MKPEILLAQVAGQIRNCPKEEPLECQSPFACHTCDAKRILAIIRQQVVAMPNPYIGTGCTAMGQHDGWNAACDAILKLLGGSPCQQK